MANSAPPEIMDEICQQLAAPELKAARLVCRSFNPVAEKYLFRQILVKINLSSFRKLAFISRHPTLCHHVRMVHYDGKLLPRKFRNRNSWLRGGIGYIVAPFKTDPVKYTNAVEFQNQLTLVELEYHHMQYCAFLDSQDRLLGENEETWLADAFACFKNLESVVYGETTKDCLLHATCRQKKSMNWRTMSTTAKETLIEPQSHIDTESNAFSFAALLEASRAEPGRVKSIEASVTWPILALKPSAFADSARTLRHLTLEVSWFHGQGSWTGDHLAMIIGSASMLQTLRLSIKRHESFKNNDMLPSVELEDLLVYRGHWPCLETFRMTGIVASDSALRKFLEAHANTLRSLELCDTSLCPLSSESWVAMIAFLQQSLHLTHIHFDGCLWSVNDCWEARTEHYYERHPGKLPRPIIPFPQDCLKKKIERYIVYGGQCPLRYTDETKEDCGDFSWLDYIP